MSRFLARLMSMNDRWAAPFGDVAHRWSHALFSRIRPIRDLLSGTWLGHPLHAASTDLPIGLLVGAVALDLLGQPAAADIVLVLVLITMVVSALSGLADYADTDGRARTRATLHGTIMVVSLIVIAASVLMRSGAPVDRTGAIGLGITALVVVLAGAFVGGDVVVNPPESRESDCADRVVTNEPGQFAEPHIQIVLDVCVDDGGSSGTTIAGLISEGGRFEILQAGGELAEIVLERGPDDRLRTSAPATILRTDEQLSASGVVSNGVEDLDITIDVGSGVVEDARACTESDRL